jgi:hypothetical protein
MFDLSDRHTMLLALGKIAFVPVDALGHPPCIGICLYIGKVRG